MNYGKSPKLSLLAALIALTACQPRTTSETDCIAKSSIPSPVWMPDEVVSIVSAVPENIAFDAWLANIVVQQEQLEHIKND